MKSYHVKTNWGTLPSIPEVSVNKFSLNKNSNESKMFFLTHYDPEIMSEVLNTEFLRSLKNDNPYGSRLFLHEEMFQYFLLWCETVILKDKDGIRDLLWNLKEKRKIVCCQVNSPFEIHCHGTQKVIKVTMLPSGFDTGCVMLLFSVQHSLIKEELPPFRVLYTGNCRISLKDLVNNPVFYENDALITIHKLYLDTSCVFEEIGDIPLRSESSTRLIKDIKRKMTEDPNTHFEITNCLPGTMGRLLYEIAEEIHMSIHVPAQVNAFFSIVPHMIYRTTARQDPDLKIHCGWEALKPVPQTNGKPSPATVTRIVLLRELCRKSNTDGQPGSVIFTEMNDVSQENFGIQNRNENIFSIYVSHPSRYEIGRLLKFLQIYPSSNTVFPLYTPKDQTMEEVTGLIRSTLKEMEKWNYESRAYVTEQYAYTYDSTFETMDPVLKLRRGTSTITEIYHYDSTEPSNGNMC